MPHWAELSVGRAVFFLEACTPWLPAPFSISKTSDYIAYPNLSLSLPLSLKLLPPFYKDPFDYTGLSRYFSLGL